MRGRKESKRRNVCVCVYLGFVFLVAVVFVSADVIHQVSLLILFFVTVVCILQEVECLQNIARTPGHTHRCVSSV